MSTTLDTSLNHGAAANLDLGDMVEAERVHRRVYVDPDVYELEMDRIFGQSWIYVGHESQVPNQGDYFTTQVGRQPVVMTRHSDGQIHVLENRCPHKGTLVCPEQSGHAKRMVCMYHGWSFDTDGALASVPVRSGYDGTAFDPNDRTNGMKRLPRVENYRGFVFASLAPDGPDLKTWAGEGMRGFDNVVDRAPDGQIEVIGKCYRTVQNSNWKIFIDNMSDGMHTSFVHHQSAHAAKRTLEKFKIEHPGGLQVTALLAGEPDQMAKIDLVAHPNGHFDMAAFAPEPTGPMQKNTKRHLSRGTAKLAPKPSSSATSTTCCCSRRPSGRRRFSNCGSSARWRSTRPCWRFGCSASKGRRKVSQAAPSLQPISPIHRPTLSLRMISSLTTAFMRASRAPSRIGCC